MLFLLWGGGLHIPEILPQGTEFVFLEEVRHLRIIAAADFHVLRCDIQLDICPDGHQVVAHADMVFGILEGLLLLRSQLLQITVDFLYGAELRN